MNAISRMKNLCDSIDNIVVKHKISYMDAVIYYCEKNNVEIEVLAKIIKSNDMLRSKIQLEAESLNYLPKSNTLFF